MKIQEIIDCVDEVRQKNIHKPNQMSSIECLLESITGLEKLEVQDEQKHEIAMHALDEASQTFTSAMDEVGDALEALRKLAKTTP